MKLRLPLAALATTTLVVLGGLYFHDTTKTVVTKSTLPVVKLEQAPPQYPTTPATTQPAATPETTDSTTTTSSETPTTVAQPVDIKTEAAQKILAAGNNEYQVTCFDNIMSYWYDWNISDTEVLHRVDTIGQTYTSYCTGWSHIKTIPVGAPETPPGLRD